MESVTSTLHMGAQSKCGWTVSGNCRTQDCPPGANSDTSGPAAQLIWNSLVEIHGLYKSYHDTLFQAASVINMALDDLENKFAPIPTKKDNTWELLLIDLLTLGTLGTAGPFFNTALKNFHYFRQGSTLDNVKGTTMTMIGQSTTIAKDLIPDDNAEWTPADQDAFSHYMGTVIDGWANVTSIALDTLFNGTTEGLKILGDTMANGKLIEGKHDDQRRSDDDLSRTQDSDLRANIQRCFFGYSIPALWQTSKTHAFIIDAGHKCGEGKKLGDYLDDDTMKATGACINDQQYYLVYPDGDALECHKRCYDKAPCRRVCKDNTFSVPPGLDSLDGKSFGGITKDDLISGSVRTWVKNGKENGGGFADPTNKGTIDNLLNVDVTTPGFMRIPVCSPEHAFQSWDSSKPGSGDFYPCNIPPGKDTCGDSTFEDRTTQVVGENERQIQALGTCAFSVQATKVHGNVNFVVGGQDVKDLINEAVKRFAQDGRIEAKGNMPCNGNVKNQPVKWMIHQPR